MGELMDGLMDRWINGIDGWINGLMDGIDG